MIITGYSKCFMQNPIEAKELVIMKRMNEIVFNQIGGYAKL